MRRSAANRPSARAEFAAAIRRVAARRAQLNPPPAFDVPAFSQIADEIDRALTGGYEGKARRLIRGWEHAELRELGDQTDTNFKSSRRRFHSLTAGREGPGGVALPDSGTPPGHDLQPTEPNRKDTQ